MKKMSCGIFFSLKFGGTTKFRNQYVTINSQYVENNNVIICNPGTNQLDALATGEFFQQK